MTQSLKNEEGKILYCICYTVFKRGEWVARREYVHAVDQQRARLAFAAGIPRGFVVGYNLEIQGIGPVIGAFEENEKMTKGIRVHNVLSLD